jgi:hypothetical protein
MKKLIATDKSRVEGDSKLSIAMSYFIKRIRPKSIIETGTYDGLGSTKCILDALTDSGNDAEFYTIECSRNSYEKAKFNIDLMGYSDKVGLNLGLTIPRSKLPNEEDIRNLCFPEEPLPEDIIVDHLPENCVAKYLMETGDTNTPDNLLGLCMRVLDNKPDMLFLDSGGHMGWQEFQYALELLEAPCYMILDDIFHIKHYKSYCCMKENPDKFKFFLEDKDENGFCIVKYLHT